MKSKRNGVKIGSFFPAILYVFLTAVAPIFPFDFAHATRDCEPLLESSRPNVPQVQLVAPKITDLSIGEIKQEILSIGDAQKLSANLARQLERAHISHKITSVLYPMSSYDSLTPFILFPNATTVVAIDSAPFIRNTERPIVPNFEAKESSGYFHFNYQAFNAQSVAGAILARLMAFYPTIRIQEIQSIEENERFDLGHLISQKYIEEKSRTVAVHGRIQFDTGPNSPLREYIYLNVFLTDDAQTQNKWWYSVLEKMKVQAVVSRAAYGGMQKFAPKFFTSVLGMLAQNNGIFVDGDAQSLNGDSMPEKYGAKVISGASFGGYNSHESKIYLFGDAAHDAKVPLEFRDL